MGPNFAGVKTNGNVSFLFEDPPYNNACFGLVIHAAP